MCLGLRFGYFDCLLDLLGCVFCFYFIVFVVCGCFCFVLLVRCCLLVVVLISLYFCVIGLIALLTFVWRADFRSVGLIVVFPFDFFVLYTFIIKVYVCRVLLVYLADAVLLYTDSLGCTVSLVELVLPCWFG